MAMGVPSKMVKGKNATPKGFEISRAEPNGFRVHLLNHSDTVSVRNSDKMDGATVDLPGSFPCFLSGLFNIDARPQRYSGETLGKLH